MSTAGTPSASVDEIFELIQDHTSLAVVRDFLKAHKAVFSATSWASLRARVDAALRDKKIGKGDLYRLLCDVEEHGCQHVFLFQRNPTQAAKMLEPTTLAGLLEAAGLPALDDKPKLLPRPPSTQTLSSVRLEDDGSLVLKYIERRERYVKAEEGEEKRLVGLGKRQWVKRWDIVEVRAINIVKLRPDGLGEVRIYVGYDDKYEKAVRGLQEATSALIPWGKFEDVSLSKAKDVLWAKRGDLTDLVAFSNSSLHDDSSGATITASTGRAEDDLCRSSAATDAMQSFIDHGGHVEGSSIYFKPQDGSPAVPARTLHVVIRGSPNEYTIPVHCGIMDYEYVLAQLRQYNR